MLVRLDLLQNANGSGYLITSDSSGSLYFLEAPSSDGFLKFTSSSRQIEWGNPSTDFYIGSAPPAGSSHLAAANLNMENFNISGVNTLTTVQLNYSSQFTDLLSWNIYQNSGSGHLAFKYSGAEQFNIGRNGSVTSSLFTGRTEKINVTSSVYVTGSLQIKGSGSSILSIHDNLNNELFSIGESQTGNITEVLYSNGLAAFSVSDTSTNISKSLAVDGYISSSNYISASLLITPLNVVNEISVSWAQQSLTSSYALNASSLFRQTSSFYNTTRNIGITGSLVVTQGITGSNSVTALYDLFGVSQSRAEIPGDVIKWDPITQKYTNGPLVVFSGFNVSSSDATGVVGFDSLPLTNDDTINFIGASGSKSGSVLTVKFDTGFERIDSQRVQSNRVVRYLSGSLNPPNISTTLSQVNLSVTSPEFQVASASVRYVLPAITPTTNGKRFTIYLIRTGVDVDISGSSGDGLMRISSPHKVDVFCANTSPSHYLITTHSLGVY